MSGENPFNRLPEDIIIYIFDKIADAKSLCICTLVSKQICFLVLQTKIVSVEIPSWLPVCNCHRDPATTTAMPLLRNLLHFIGKPVTSLWRLLKQPSTTDAGLIPNYIPIFKFLNKLSCVESLTLNLGFSKQTSFEPLVKWKYDNSGFIFICAKGVCLNSSQNDNDVLAPPTSRLMSLVICHLMDAFLRLKILKLTFNNFPKLKNVLVMDSLNQGQVVMDEDDIASIRDEEEPLTEDHDVKFFFKLWHENVLHLREENVPHLPGPGLVMKEVTVAMFKEINTDDDVDNDDDDDDCLMMFKNGFEGTVYSEISALMVKRQACFETIVSSKQLMQGNL